MIRGRRVLALAMLVAAVAGCTAGDASSPGPATATPVPVVGATPVVTASPPPASPGDSPPEATVAVDGGDPVTGQLGTYVWGESGSDAPWLPGTPIAVGAGETLVVALAPPVTVSDWSARYGPAEADGPDGAVPLAAGTGPPAFTAPPVGRWTVAVTIRFADGLGEATYSWAVGVR